MAYTVAWDETAPAGTAVVSQGDDRIRELKVQMRERLEEFLIADMDSDPVVVKTTTLFRSFPATTAMVFFQAAAPTGWTQVVTQNDKALRVVSTAGGGSGGSSSFATGAPTHTHTGPSHTHTLNIAGALDGVTLGNYSSGVYYVPYGTSIGTTAAGGTGATGSEGAWVPYYIDVIICTKD